jgi:hypothetical protein
MSDIVKMLLVRSSDEAGIGWTPTTVVHVPAGLLHQAADEITRLRAREAELVEALEDIADGMGEDDPVEIGKYAPAIARAALGDDK